MKSDILLMLAASYTLPHVRVKMDLKQIRWGRGAVTGICIKGVTDQCVKNSVGGAGSLKS
jgi:hypothetical protein